MIQKKIARELVRKWIGMIQTPTDKADIELRVDTLAARCGSEQHAALVAEAVLERETFFPSVAVIVQTAANTTDPVGSEATQKRKACPYCGGEGWRTVDGPHGTSAAYPCNHTQFGDPRMGVAINPAVAAHYMHEAREVPARVEAWDASKANPNHPNHPHQRKLQEMSRARVPAEIAAAAATDEDIERIRQAQERNRSAV